MTAADERELLEIARMAATAAGVLLYERFGHHQSGIHTKSGPTDPVSDADVAAEQAIRHVLARHRPDDAILGEEGGATAGGDLRWVVDPLDGTVNFLFGIPAFGVSVACEDADGALVGAVLDPLRGELFVATRDGPATLDGGEVHGSGRAELATALVATGFAYDAHVRERQGAVIARVLPRVRDIRRVGAAALDLCWSACGRFDAYFERGVHHWVAAPPALIDELMELVGG